MRLEKIYYDGNTGVEIYKEIAEELEKKENSEKVKLLFKKLAKNPNSLTIDEITKLMKITQRNTKVKLDFNEDSYFIIKKNLKLLKELDVSTVGVIYMLCQMISHDGRIKYDNNKVLSKYEDVREYLGISKHIWKIKVKPELDANNILKKETVNNKKCLLLNPLYSIKDRTVTETMFLAFYEELKKHLHPLDFLYLYKLHQIRPK